MGPTIIARNYAETLLTLADRQGGQAVMEEYAHAMREVSDLLESEPLIRQFIESPMVDADVKKNALRASLQGRVPDLFLRFLLVVVDKRRQRLLREIADAYHGLVDERLGRVRASIVLARAPGVDLQNEIVRSLEKRLGKTVIPEFQVDPDLLGGIVVRVGDRILDGSLRRRLGLLRRRLLEVQTS